MPEQNQDQMPVVLQNQNLVAFTSMLDLVPEVEEGSYEGILEALFNAKNIYELDTPFNAESLSAYKDTVITINSARRAPSEFKGGLGVYLILDCTNMETGEKFTVTTGSIVTVAQVLRMFSLDVLPAVVIPRVADKATKSGFYPQHLEIVPRQPQKSQSDYVAPTAEEEAKMGF